jgi:hypothetical protein
VGPIPFESTTKGIDSSRAAITALTGVENPAFPAIREWITQFLQDESEVSSSLIVYATSLRKTK